MGAGWTSKVFESVKRLHSLLTDEYEALKVRSLMHLRLCRKNIIQTLSSSDIVQDPDQPTDPERLEELANPLWKDITHPRAMQKVASTK